MPIDFPTSPTTGDVYTYQGKSWIWNGTGWDVPRSLSEIGAVQTFANAAARTAAIPSPTEGIVSYLNDVDLLQTNNGSAWVTTGNAGANSYNFVQTLYYTSSGTFTKATYPWLRAVRVRVQGGGGGGGGSQAQAAAKGGGGGAYAEKFITDIAGLASSVTVTRGAGGAGGAAGPNNGSAGGQSAFGTISANGGGGGYGAATAGTTPQTGALLGGSGSGITANADFSIAGMNSLPGAILRASTVGNGAVLGSDGGPSFLGYGGFCNASALAGNAGQQGGGGGGGYAGTSESAIAGLVGGNGIVIVELYA
jgi:hypothetical protein